jgi:uncharacterized protein YdgA (DUF945 family)
VNRWIVVVLVALAAIVLVSPEIVGRLAEKQVADSLHFAASESDEVVVTAESFERGWFTSQGRHRIELRQGALRALLGIDDQVPTLIVETRVDHGLVPFTSLARDSGSLKPGLARAVSTMKLDRGGGEILDIAGNLFSEVGLGGETSSRFVLQAGSGKIDNATIEWQGADVAVRAITADGSLAYQGEIPSLSIIDAVGRMTLGGVTVTAEQQRSDYNFSTGSLKLGVDSITIERGDDRETAFGPLATSASIGIDGQRLSAAARFDLSHVPVAGLGAVDISVDAVFKRLDAQSIQGIVASLRNSRADPDRQITLRELYPFIEADVQTLLTSGLEIRIDKIAVALADSELMTTLHGTLPPSNRAAEFSWPSLLLALDASADMRLPVELFEIAAGGNPDLGTLVAMGVLRKVGDYYQMQASFAKGLLTINGAPLPLPLPLP